MYSLKNIIVALVAGVTIFLSPVRAQSSWVDMRVSQEVYSQTDNTPLAILTRQTAPINTTYLFPNSINLLTLSGYCDSQLHIVNGTDSSYGNLVVLYTDSLSAMTANTTYPGTAIGGGEIITNWCAAVPTRGTLQVSIYITNMIGGNINSCTLVDIGNDNIYDWAFSGTNTSGIIHEFPLTLTPTGTPIRLVFSDMVSGDNITSSKGYFFTSLEFFPDASPCVQYTQGCSRLNYARWADGSMSFAFPYEPPSSPCFLILGSPLTHPRPIHQLAGHCLLETTIDADVIVPSLSIWYTRRLNLLMPGLGQAVIQGMVIKPDGIWMTDSWIIN